MGNDMFNEEQLADAAVRVDAAVLKDSLTTDAPSLADAVREAEEALAIVGVCLCGCGTGECCGAPYYRALRSLLAAVKTQAPANFYCASCARAVGIPVHPDAIGVRLYGGRISPAPAIPEAVREAEEHVDKAMRDVFGGVDQYGDYCGHPMIPAKLAHAVQALLAALSSSRPPDRTQEKA